MMMTIIIIIIIGTSAKRRKAKQQSLHVTAKQTKLQPVKVVFWPMWPCLNQVRQNAILIMILIKLPRSMACWQACVSGVLLPWRHSIRPHPSEVRVALCIQCAH